MFTKMIKQGHYRNRDNDLVFLWTGLFAQPHSSAITFLEYEEGCPQIVRVLNASQELEITKSSFNMALEEIKIHMSI